MSELSPDSRALMDAGKSGDEPTDADKARLRSALLRSLAVGAAGVAAGSLASQAISGAAAGKGAAAAASGAAVAKGTAAAVATVSTTVGVAGKVIAAIALAGAIGGGITLGRSMTTSQAPDASSRAEAPIAAASNALRGARAGGQGFPSADSAESRGRAEDGAEGQGLPALEESAGARAGAPGAAGAAGAGGGLPSTLAAETRLLREVHSALQSGQPERALAILDSAAAANEKGELAEEREAARILSLCKLGRVKEAAVALDQFVRQKPRSPLLDRIRASCSAPEAPKKPAPGDPPFPGDSPPPAGSASPPVSDDSSPSFNGDIND